MAIAIGGYRYRDQFTVDKYSTAETGVVVWTSIANIRAADNTVASATIAAVGGDATAVLQLDFSSLPANAVIESVTTTLRARANRDCSLQTGTPGCSATLFKSGGVTAIDQVGFSSITGNIPNVLEDWTNGPIGTPVTRADLLTATVELTATADDALSMTYGADCVTVTVVYNT